MKSYEPAQSALVKILSESSKGSDAIACYVTSRKDLMIKLGWSFYNIANKLYFEREKKLLVPRKAFPCLV
jgi:hypothetical protein